MTAGHGAAHSVLTVDLGAIRANYRLLCERLGGARCGGVVKADGYGLGAAEVAAALKREGCADFFVAQLGEGIALRPAIGDGTNLYILGGLLPGEEAAAVEAGAVPVLNSLDQIARWRDMARKAERLLPAAIQFDTGMGRLGLSLAELGRLAANAGALDGIELRLVMSHLACADMPDNPANAEQLRRFEEARAKLPAAPASLANSGGVFLGAGYRFDLARPGIALYGGNPAPAGPNPMRQVVRLEAAILQSRLLQPGETVGYGRLYVAEAPVQAVTVSLGYADGWPRNAAGAGFLDGQSLPFLGRVSMDSIVLDASALPPEALRPGRLVGMIGPHQPVDAVARLAGTIPYEVLTGLGRRAVRRYVGE